MMISLGSGTQALSMAMQRTIPPYPSVEITARMRAASGATIRSSKCTREPYATRFAADKRKDFRLEGFRVRVIASRRMISSSVRRSRPLRHARSEEHTSELQSQSNLVCRLLLEKKKKKKLLDRSDYSEIL